MEVASERPAARRRWRARAWRRRAASAPSRVQQRCDREIPALWTVFQERFSFGIFREYSQILLNVLIALYNIARHRVCVDAESCPPCRINSNALLRADEVAEKRGDGANLEDCSLFFFVKAAGCWSLVFKKNAIDVCCRIEKSEELGKFGKL